VGCDFKAGLFGNRTKENINIVNSVGEEMDLIPLQDTGSLVGMAYLARNSRKTCAAGILGRGSASASLASFVSHSS
jgi:hypothetical protein